ncbi:hypothetical protein LMG27174_01510 [Paraburkholderia rhynchosiae]|uniref:Uncharacterized protein n=1 Tax=Paraburkholderia rhynchosiae TaxID=487049 RepID=A0A6J5AR87_9BURK|nr:hypothetical protein LMG27174_01510 [Paraburkholderia rhynchosiae]
MWICLSDSFLFRVASDQDRTALMVGARRRGDIEAVFGDKYPITTLPGRDYQFRAFIPRPVVGHGDRSYPCMLAVIESRRRVGAECFQCWSS